jgi:hypothetical protein
MDLLLINPHFLSTNIFCNIFTIYYKETYLVYMSLYTDSEISKGIKHIKLQFQIGISKRLQHDFFADSMVNNVYIYLYEGFIIVQQAENSR